MYTYGRNRKCYWYYLQHIIGALGGIIRVYKNASKELLLQRIVSTFLIIYEHRLHRKERVANIQSQCQEMHSFQLISHLGIVLLFSIAITWPLDSLTDYTYIVPQLLICLSHNSQIRVSAYLRLLLACRGKPRTHKAFNALFCSMCQMQTCFKLAFANQKPFFPAFASKVELHLQFPPATWNILNTVNDMRSLSTI